MGSDRPGLCAHAAGTTTRSAPMRPRSASSGRPPEREASLAEAIVRANQGIVTADARAAFERAAALDKDMVTPRFYLALALAQEGKKAEAATALQTLIDGAPADAPWVDFVQIGRSAQPEERPAATPPPAKPDRRKPMSRPPRIYHPKTAQAMIEGMVGQLAARLEADPKDSDGWARLVRSYMVLGRSRRRQGGARQGADGARRRCGWARRRRGRSAFSRGSVELVKSGGMTRKQRRLTLIGLAGVVLAVAAGLVLYALSDRIVFFNSPSDLIAKPAEPGSRIRLGGLVETRQRRQGRRRQRQVQGHRRQRIGRRRLSGHPSRSLPRGTGRRRRGCRRGQRRLHAPTRCSPSTTRNTCRGKSSSR